MSDEPIYKLTYYTGVKKLEPINYRIRESRHWFRKSRYYLDSDLMSLRPFGTRAEAGASLAYVNLFRR